MTMLTSSLVSDSIVDSYFCSVLQVCIQLFTGHCNLLYSDNWSILGVRISIQYFCLNFSIKSVFLEALSMLHE